MKRETYWYFLIEREVLRDYVATQGPDGLMDMLRYDGATVECNAPTGFWMLSKPNTPPTRERWASFGIKIEGGWPSSIGGAPYELQKWAESHAEAPSRAVQP